MGHAPQPAIAPAGRAQRMTSRLSRLWRSLRRPDRGLRDAPAPRPQQVLLICHSADGTGLEIMDNLCGVLEFGKIRFAILEIGRHSPWPALESFDAIILCTERIWELSEERTAALARYVARGGGMLVAYRGWHPGLSELFGFDRPDPGPLMHITSGLVFTDDIVPGARGLVINDANWQVEHSRYEIGTDELAPGSSILATDVDGRPVLWRRPFGEGRVLYWNSQALGHRVLRGFALQSILDVMPVAVSAIAGFAMFHVDDFPPSLSEARREPVSSEFPQLDWNGFFFDVWHPDMMALREKHGLRYSWYVVMDYQDIGNRSPDAAPDAAPHGREILRKRFARMSAGAESDEYGFHGYNHDPLTTEFWPDLKTLDRKLRLARKLWETEVPAPLPTSWVPANNWYHPDHVRRLKAVFPEITEACGIYSRGETALGEYREFDPEPWEPGLTCLPRETYGYVLEPGIRLMMLSQIASFGLWTHFVHPDDIYDIPAPGEEGGYHRNSRTLFWRQPNEAGEAGLLSRLDAWLTEVRDLFPWLEFVTTAQAAERLRAHRRLQPDILIAGSHVDIRGEADALYYVRTAPGIALRPGAGAEIVDRRPSAGGALHVVRCAAGTARIGFTPRTGGRSGPAA